MLQLIRKKLKKKMSQKNYYTKKTGEQGKLFACYRRYYFIASQLAWIASATSFADFPLV